MPGGGDITFVEQHAEQLIDYKKELASIYEELVSLDLDEDDLFFLHARLEKLHFACSHKVRRNEASRALREERTGHLRPGQETPAPRR